MTEEMIEGLSGGFELGPINLVKDDWIVVEAKQIWSDLRYRLGTDDRRSNMSFEIPSFGALLVAIPTSDSIKSLPPEKIEEYPVVTLDQYVYAVKSIVMANEGIRKDVYKSLAEE